MRNSNNHNTYTTEEFLEIYDSIEEQKWVDKLGLKIKKSGVN